MKHFITILCALCVLCGFESHAAAKPNVLLILADDLGIECLSSYGGTSHKTPNLDRLAKEGMRFTHCFSNPFCSPSRGTLLTGRYPFQNGLKVVLHSKQQEDIYLRPEQPSFVRQLKEHGYGTQLVGKWHVSLEHKHDTIRAFGFDHYQTWRIFDEQGGKTTRYWNPHLVRDGRIIAGETHHRYGPDEDLMIALDFMHQSAATQTPFLVTYATCLPHYPWSRRPTARNNATAHRTPRTKATRNTSPT
jgi:arylsulfatase A